MKTKKEIRSKITVQDYLLANRKASREEEILAHGKQIIFRRISFKQKNKYDRNKMKKNILQTEDVLFHFRCPAISVELRHRFEASAILASASLGVQ